MIAEQLARASPSLAWRPCAKPIRKGRVQEDGCLRAGGRVGVASGWFRRG